MTDSRSWICSAYQRNSLIGLDHGPGSHVVSRPVMRDTFGINKQQTKLNPEQPVESRSGNTQMFKPVRWDLDVSLLRCAHNCNRSKFR